MRTNYKIYVLALALLAAPKVQADGIRQIAYGSAHVLACGVNYNLHAARVNAELQAKEAADKNCLSFSAGYQSAAVKGVKVLAENPGVCWNGVESSVAVSITYVCSL